MSIPMASQPTDHTYALLKNLDDNTITWAFTLISNLVIQGNIVDYVMDERGGLRSVSILKTGHVNRYFDIPWESVQYAELKSRKMV